MTTELDPTYQQAIIDLAAANHDIWESVLRGSAESKAWFIGMTAYHFEGVIDRKAAATYIDQQADAIRQLDEADGRGLKAWKHSRLPALRRACGVPEEAPVEDVLAKAVVEGTEAEFTVGVPVVEAAANELPMWTTRLVAGVDVAQSNHDDANAPPRMEISISDIQPDGTRRVTSWHAVEVVSHDQQKDPDFVTLDMKGPPVETKVSFTKAKLAELLEQAFTDGVGCDSRYDGDTDNLLACVGDILWDAFYEADADDDDDEDLEPTVDPVVTLHEKPTGPQFAGLDAQTGDPVLLEPGELYPRPMIISMGIGPSGLAESMITYARGPASPEDIIDAMDLKPGTPFDLPEGFVLHVKPGDFKPIPGENPEIDYDQLGGWLFEMIIAAGVCTYDEAKPERPFHLYEVLAPATDNGTYAEAEHVIAKAIDGGLSRFKDRMKLPDVDVRAYKSALAFEPD